MNLADTRNQGVTVERAKEMIREDKSIRAAVLGADGSPMAQHESCRVFLFNLVGEADSFFRDRRNALLDGGWEQTYGALNRGLLKFERGDKEQWWSLDKRRP